MIYLIQLAILLICFIYLAKKEKYSWHAIITTYFFFILFVDIAESTFCYFLGFYKFTTHLIADVSKEDPMGLLICDGYILPLTGMILFYYATKVKNLWKLSFVFASIYGILEFLYTKLGYLTYYIWSTWISVAIYFLESRFINSFAFRFMRYEPPMPYFIRIAGATYAITLYLGAYLGGGFIGLYHWRPLIIRNPSVDDRFTHVCISFALALLAAIIIPKIKPRFRPIVFMVFAVLMIAFSYLAYSQGWLIYNKWNQIFMVLYWIVSFSAVALYDHWEFNYKNN